MTNSTKEIFKYNVKYYRNSKNYTQEYLSEITGISRDYLSEIERGKRTPSFKRILLIADALDIEVYKLFKQIEE